jgi:uncharacterized protein (TIGR00251 family)
VVPGSSKDDIAGWLGETLKVRVRSAAERGRANAAAQKVLAEALGVAERDVQIVAGHTSARKVVEISGLAASDFERRLAALSLPPS